MAVLRIVADLEVGDPKGVRRFYLRDPAGRLLNVLTHED